jgi:hypothetical protein
LPARAKVVKAAEGARGGRRREFATHRVAPPERPRHIWRGLYAPSLEADPRTPPSPGTLAPKLSPSSMEQMVAMPRGEVLYENGRRGHRPAVRPGRRGR